MSIELQRPEKELWHGVTKADLARHYIAVARRMLPHLADRPLTLVRAPNGIDAHRFFQKDAHHLSKGLERCPADEVRHVMAASVHDLLELTDQACVELHGWVSRCDAPQQPDRMVFDLDPPDEGHFDDVRDAARTLCRLLERRGAAPHAMVTGSKGIHVIVPIVRGPDHDEVTRFMQAVAGVLIKHDDRLTMELRKAKRHGRIFVDTLRNRPRQTAILPWSTRARPKATVATPIPLDLLDDDSLRPDAWRVGSIPDEDPWPTYFGSAVPLDRLT